MNLPAGGSFDHFLAEFPDEDRPFPDLRKLIKNRNDVAVGRGSVEAKQQVG